MINFRGSKTSLLLPPAILLASLLHAGPTKAGGEAGAQGPSVDVDGDGKCSQGDREVLRLWRELGGKLEQAVAGLDPALEPLPLARFFGAAGAALGKDAALLRARSEAGGEPGGPCATAGPLSPAFGATPGQVFAVLCSPELLPGAAGLALRAASGDLFVARHVDGSGGGVTRVRGVGRSLDGRVPLAPGRAASVLGEVPLANRLAYDAESDTLLLTAPAPAEPGPRKGLPRRKSRLLRLRALDAASPRSCDVLPGGAAAILDPYGVAVLTEDLPCDGKRGDILVTHHAPYRDFRTFGSLQLVRGDPCGESTRILLGLKGLDLPGSLAVGDFHGAGPPGIYFAQRVAGATWELRRSWPQVLPTECSWDLKTPPAHAIFNAKLGIAEVAFDPYSASLLATDGEENIWRVRPEAEAPPVLLASGLKSPRGLGFLESGVLLVSEEGRLSAVDGWRHKFLRGDVDGSSKVDLADARRLTAWLARGTEEPGCLDAADVDDDGRLCWSDAVRLFDLVAGQGAPLPPPGPGLAGHDPTPDLLGCRTGPADSEISW